MSAPDRPVVIGIGNPYRRDDGVGWAVVQRLDDRPDVDVETCDGETGRLLESWRGRPTAVVVDAVRGGGEPGTVLLLEPGALHDRATASTHGVGIVTAHALARELGLAPDRLFVVGVVGADFGHGSGCSPMVAAAIERALGLVGDLLDGRVGTVSANR